MSYQSSYQPGDRVISVGGREVRLRLTLGALAEICDRLGTRDTGELAERLARAEPADIDTLALCLLRPVHGESAQALARALPPARTAPLIAALFEEAFA